MKTKVPPTKDRLVPHVRSKMRGEITELDGVIRYLEGSLQKVRAHKESLCMRMPTDDLILSLLSRGWTQAAVAEHCGVSPPSLCRWVGQHRAELGEQGYHPKRGPRQGSRWSRRKNQ